MVVNNPSRRPKNWGSLKNQWLIPLKDVYWWLAVFTAFSDTPMSLFITNIVLLVIYIPLYSQYIPQLDLCTNTSRQLDWRWWWWWWWWWEEMKLTFEHFKVCFPACDLRSPWFPNVPLSRVTLNPMFHASLILLFLLLHSSLIPVFLKNVPMKFRYNWYNYDITHKSLCSSHTVDGCEILRQKDDWNPNDKEHGMFTIKRCRISLAHPPYVPMKSHKKEYQEISLSKIGLNRWKKPSNIIAGWWFQTFSW